MSVECCTTIRVTKVITEEERSEGLLKKGHQLQYLDVAAAGKVGAT